MTYVWPLSGCRIPDLMNTSFGPRINKGRWDFHDGIDFPASTEASVHAVRSGKIRFAGSANSNGFSSRHVVIEIDVPPDEDPLYAVYLHLSEIEPGIAREVHVSTGTPLGKVGEDGAQYPHLHFEIRRGTYREHGSVHPLHYLPYTSQNSFSAPVVDRFNRHSVHMAARLLFGAPDRQRGDLSRVEVDFLRNDTVVRRRVVDFDDKYTINEGNGDSLVFVKDVGVEGYQQSRMDDPHRPLSDLRYGILVRHIPSDVDALVARLFDVGGHSQTSSPVAIPQQANTDTTLTFDDGVIPAPWSVVPAAAWGNNVAIVQDTGPGASSALRCLDDSPAMTTGCAALEYALPPNRFQWTATGRFNVEEGPLDPGQSVYVLYFRGENGLCVAARLYKQNGALQLRLRAKSHAHHPSGASHAAVTIGRWAVWELRALRLGTREATAVLLVDGAERDRLTWDATFDEPRHIRVGIGYSSKGATASVLVNEVRISESF